MDTATISTSTRPRAPGAAAAIAAAAGFLGIAAFQVALAAGAPLGQAAWGGAHDGQLPTSLRVASAVAVGVWVLAALIVLGRAGFEAKPLPPTVLRLGPRDPAFLAEQKQHLGDLVRAMTRPGRERRSRRQRS